MIRLLVKECNDSPVPMVACVHSTLGEKVKITRVSWLRADKTWIHGHMYCNKPTVDPVMQKRRFRIEEGTVIGENEILYAGKLLANEPPRGKHEVR